MCDKHLNLCILCMPYDTFLLGTTLGNNCRLLCHLLVILSHFANNVDPDQTSRSSLIRVNTVGLYAKIGLKSLQEYSADDINR